MTSKPLARGHAHLQGAPAMSHPPCSRPRCSLLALAIGSLASVVAVPAQAANAAQGASSAYGISVEVAAGPAQVTVVPTPRVGGSAPPAYDQHQSVAQVDASSSTLGSVAQSGVLEVEAQSAAPAGDGA